MHCMGAHVTRANAMNMFTDYRTLTIGRYEPIDQYGGRLFVHVKITCHSLLAAPLTYGSNNKNDEMMELRH